MQRTYEGIMALRGERGAKMPSVSSRERVICTNSGNDVLNQRSEEKLVSMRDFVPDRWAYAHQLFQDPEEGH